jgi:hypothetical protein
MNKICEEAKLYYYDFLFKKDKSQIQEQILNHFRHCQNCQKRIYELKTALTQAELQNKNHSGLDIANTLKTHFSYILHDITCKIAKPFLPGMLDPSMQIKIPTPITTHLDHCPECVSDMGKISELKLSNTHLSRLSSLFSQKPDEDNITCSKAKYDIMAFVMMAFQASNEQIMKHLCLCSKCRSEIYNYRETVLSELMRENSDKPCFLSSRISNNELFDFVVPYGLDQVQYKISEVIQSRVTHMRRCPFCLQKIQEFHNTIYNIAERPDSKVITTYNIEHNPQPVQLNSSENLYEGFPINVEITHTNEKAEAASKGSTINFTSVLKHKILSSNIKSITKKGFAGIFIAAVLLTSMLFYSPNAGAINLAQIISAFEKSDNVHISLFTPGKSEPVQEQWNSRSSNILITKTGSEIVLSNINDKSIVTKNTETNISSKKSMSLDQIAGFDRRLNNSFGLTPFYNISNLPEGAKWNKVTTETQNSTSEAEIYELTYQDDTFNDLEDIMLRFTLKPDSDLPVKVETFKKFADESEYSPGSTFVLEYLNDDTEITDIQVNILEK